MSRILFLAFNVLSLMSLQNCFSQDLIKAGVFGSYGADYIQGYSIDDRGDLLICGTFQNSIDLNFESGEQDPMTAISKYDIYVAKYDIKGNYKWAIQLGGDPYEYNEVRDIATDKDGNIFITGFTDGWIDFDPSETTDSINEGAESMFYIAKYSPAGAYLWAHGFGNDQLNGSLKGWSIDVDPVDNNVVLCGVINGAIDFDPSAEEAILEPERHADFFLAKYSTEGEYLWAKVMTHPDDYGYGTPLRVQIDADQNIYMGGYFAGVFDMDPSEAVHNISSEGDTNGFLSKYNKDGEHQWSMSLGAETDDYFRNFRLLDGKIYIVGSFSGTVDFDQSEAKFELISAGEANGYDGFVAIYESDGTFHSAFSLEGKMVGENKSSLEIQDIDLDRFGDIYLIGGFFGTIDVDPSEGTTLLNSTGGISDYDMFLAKYDPDNNYLWAINAGGDKQEQGFFTHISRKGEVIAMGYYNDWCDFDPSSGEQRFKSNGSHDIYLAWYFSYSTVGIDDFESSGEKVLLYPNPVQGSLILESEKLMDRMEIYSTSGSLMHTQQIHQYRAIIDLPALIPGSYILRLYQDGEVKHMKFIKLE